MVLSSSPRRFYHHAVSWGASHHTVCFQSALDRIWAVSRPGYRRPSCYDRRVHVWCGCGLSLLWGKWGRAVQLFKQPHTFPNACTKRQPPDRVFSGATAGHLPCTEALPPKARAPVRLQSLLPLGPRAAREADPTPAPGAPDVGPAMCPSFTDWFGLKLPRGLAGETY